MSQHWWGQFFALSSSLSSALIERQSWWWVFLNFTTNLWEFVFHLVKWVKLLANVSGEKKWVKCQRIFRTVNKSSVFLDFVFLFISAVSTIMNSNNVCKWLHGKKIVIDSNFLLSLLALTSLLWLFLSLPQTKRRLEVIHKGSALVV